VSTVSDQVLVDLVIGWVKQNTLANGSDNAEISENTNLMESGLLDSFSFVDLILFIENCTGAKIDLIDVEPEEFTIVRGLCQLAMRNGQARNGSGHDHA
jgi:acyl carrier protein